MNKTLHFTICAVMAFIIVGCTKSDDQNFQKGQYITVTASHMDNHTKTTVLDGGTTVYWEPGDEIKLFYDGTGSLFTNQNTEISKTAKFSGTLNAVFLSNEGISSDNPLWGLYPYREDAIADNSSVTTTLPSNQIGKAGSFAKEMNLSLGKSTTLAISFLNVCGGIRFSLTNDDVKEVVFESEGGENIAGKVKLGFEEDIPVVQEISEGKSSITLTAPNNGTFEKDKWYYIVVLPGTLSNGFNMTFNTETKSASVVSPKSVTFKRGVFASIADVDKDLVYNEMVDLGLSVKWATCNVGADIPEDYGIYFAWGDVTGQTRINSKWSNGGFNDSHSFELDTKNHLKPEYDAANVKLGGKFRMPTIEEFEELIDATNCNIEFTSQNEVNGFLITSKKEGYIGRSIFLPAVGYGGGGNLNNVGKYGGYWSSTFYYEGYAYSFYFTQYVYRTSGFTNTQGRCIRPVLK